MPQVASSANPPIRTPFFPQIGTDQKNWPSWFTALTWIFAYPWLAWFQYVGNQLNKASANPPAASNSPGKQNMIAADANFIYVCIQGNTSSQPAIWKRAPLVAF